MNRRGAVAFFYKPSRRGSGSFSAAVDISGTTQENFILYFSY
jgi:hypothetical protein